MQCSMTKQERVTFKYRRLLTRDIGLTVTKGSHEHIAHLEKRMFLHFLNFPPFKHPSSKKGKSTCTNLKFQRFSLPSFGSICSSRFPED
jgi:hypothetical protein